MKVERWLLLAAPVVAMAVVALGLGLGARRDVRAAVVYGAPESQAKTGLAWQLATFDEAHGVREPVALPEVVVIARAGDHEVHWKGATNEDGFADFLLDLPSAPVLDLEVRCAGAWLAGGRARPAERAPPVASSSTWASFARREGAIALDVAVLGQRVASGFPASIWVRATDAVTHAAWTGVAVEAESDTSLTSLAGEPRTDARGWMHFVARPMGLAVALILHARAPQGRTGDWAGALVVSPGAFEVVASDRYAPDEPIVLDIAAPNLRTTAYVEVDDAHGRAWGSAVPLIRVGDATPHASARVPKLAPGLYWAVVSSDPMGGAVLGPGTLARPFFVAANDEAALLFGTDREECALPPSTTGLERVLEPCLALTQPVTVPRWTAIDGFSEVHARDAHRRVQGLSVALTAIVIAAVMETLLLLRTWRLARSRLRAATSQDEEAVEADPAGNLVVALLVALLGFALLAALLLRTA